MTVTIWRTLTKRKNLNNASRQAWPCDADGDVFRRLAAAGFDLSKETDIDFNIDFDTWPPSPALMQTLEKRFANVALHEPDSHGDGYAQLVLRNLLTYDFVISTQAALTILAAPYGGLCESWGVMQD